MFDFMEKVQTFNWSKVPKLSLSTVKAKIFLKFYVLSKNVSNYAPGTNDPKLMIFWFYRKSLE